MFHAESAEGQRKQRFISAIFAPQHTLRETNNFTQRVQSGKESRG